MSTSKQGAIGIFDSGIGGLTVASEIARLLPNEDLIYLGDTARLPYGTKSEETVKRYAKKCVDFLIKKNIKVIVIACNTVSSVALTDLQKIYYPVPVLGVVEPGAKFALKVTKSKRIGLIGQERTIRSKSYEIAIKLRSPDAKIFTASAPLLVPLAEEGWIDHPVSYLAIKEYLKPLIKHEIDTLILGCTHYPLFKGVIRKVLKREFGVDLNLVDSAVSISEELYETLKVSSLLNPQKKEGKREFYMTDLPERFSAKIKLFFRFPYDLVKQVNI